MSRQQFPKQFLQLMGEQSLLQETVARISGSSFAPAIIVSGEEQRSLIERQLAEAPIETILLEPTGRNTAAAAALAALWVQRSGRDEILLLMPADHVVGDRDAFLKAIESAVPRAEQGAIVTFGAQPSGPNTQYGYIEADTAGGAGDGSFRIARFHEKPDVVKAAEYVESGRFFWNAGIFLVKASTLLNEMRQFLPASLDALTRSVDQGAIDGLFFRPAPDEFNHAENISIDHGIMEKTARGVVVPVQMNWSDVGSWDAVWTLGPKDSAGNVISGDVVSLDTKGCLLRSDGPLVATIGLENVAVIAVGDAVLVAPMDRMADLKALVEQVRAQHSERVTSPPAPARKSKD